MAEFRDAIYPGLISTGKVERGDDKPYHTVINGENFHVLQALTYTHSEKVDCVYIDPPYNTGAKDWKYNNDYVESDDLYRHSKWLAFMERRLLVSQKLLNPVSSVLIVTIDEKEVHRLGLLLEQTFAGASIQLVTIVTNPSGTSRDHLSRVEEYAYFVFIGSAQPCRMTDNLLTGTGEPSLQSGLTWESLLRRGNSWYRETRPNLWYPVLVNPQTRQIMGVGSPFSGANEADRPRIIDGYDAAWPVRTDGRLGIWRKDGTGLAALVEKGYAYATAYDVARGTWSMKYLMSGTVKSIEDGTITVTRANNTAQVEGYGYAAKSIPKTVWNRPQHNAGMHGSAMLRSLIPGRRFPFPKSLYAVEDALRIAVGDNPNAVVLDFFAGSGTTAHAVFRLNRGDGGHRTSIIVTNNEVSADEQLALRRQGLRPGDEAWEEHGICDYITKPRIDAAVTGRTPQGDLIEGSYRFTDDFPMKDGFAENTEYFTLTYETPIAVRHSKAFERIAPLLWLRAGSRGRRIDRIPEVGWDVADTYGILFDLDLATPFSKAVTAGDDLSVAFIVTDDDRRYQSVVRRLPNHVKPIRLYESYVSNFRISPSD